MFHPKGPTFFELAKQALSSTVRGYDLLAPKFEYTSFRTPDFVFDAIAPHIGKVDSIDTALDLCCGTGAAMRMLRPLCRQRVTGIDFSPGMLEEARKILADAPGDAEIELVEGDVLEATFDEQFDVAVCFGALGHIRPKDEPQFVQQIARSLKIGGRFVFCTTFMPSLWSPTYWMARGFNAAMHVRNLLIRPSFIMFYLTFLLPKAKSLLEQNGFEVEVREEVFGKRFRSLKLVIATRVE